MEHVLYFKLVTGEHIISIVESNDDEFIMLHRPLQLFIQNTLGGAAVRVAKWIPFTEENDFPLQIKHVVMKAMPTRDISDYYFEALNKLDETTEVEKEVENFMDNNEEDVTMAMFEKYSNTSIVVH